MPARGEMLKETRTVKTLLSFGALVIAISAMTVSAAAACLPVSGNCVSRPPVPVQEVARRGQPQQPKEKGHRLAPAPHVGKRGQPQQPEEKAHRPAPPPHVGKRRQPQQPEEKAHRPAPAPHVGKRGQPQQPSRSGPGAHRANHRRCRSASDRCGNAPTPKRERRTRSNSAAVGGYAGARFHHPARRRIGSDKHGRLVIPG